MPQYNKCNNKTSISLYTLLRQLHIFNHILEVYATAHTFSVFDIFLAVIFTFRTYLTVRRLFQGNRTHGTKIRYHIFHKHDIYGFNVPKEVAKFSLSVSNSKLNYDDMFQLIKLVSVASVTRQTLIYVVCCLFVSI